MIYSIESYEKKSLIKIYNKSINKLDNFFGIKWERNKPKIFIIKNRKTINKIAPNTPYKIKGGIQNNNVFLLEKNFWEKESKNSNTNYYKENILHELVHLYFLQLSGKNKKPDWLWEGLANYLSKTYMKKSPKKFKNFLDHFEKNNKEVYKESGFAIKFLIKKYRKEKILKLIKKLKNIKTEKEFKKEFKKIYNFDLNYNNFNL